MVNILIYLRKEHDPKELVKHLLNEKLIARASIDTDNINYKIKDGVLLEENYNVITALSKALLINSVIEAAELMIGQPLAINSTPIVGSSSYYNEIIKSNTIPI